MTASADGAVRMAVLSDCHASSQDEEPSSDSTWVHVDDDDPDRNPLAGLEAFVEEHGDIRADVLLCPGDLCDKADWDALPYVWRRLESLTLRLGAGTLIATVGNHDIDSHARHGASTVEHALRALRPHFPTCASSEIAEYWDERIYVVAGDDWQVVTLNSSLMRVLNSPDEKDHGHIEDATLRHLKERLRGRSRKVNVLLCHHHPLPSTRLDPDDRSHMENGDRLVRLLDDELSNHWFVVHGHKHEPDLDHLPGTGEAPIRLAAGSVGANLRGTLGPHVRNQFHLIEFPVRRYETIELTLAGTVRSWTWQPRTGWRDAVEREGLPATAGFGHKASGTAVAQSVVRWASQNGLNPLHRTALLTHEPKIEFMLPKDVARFVRTLENDLGCRVLLNTAGLVETVVLP